MNPINAQVIAEALGGRKSGNNWICHCPAHDDSRPSLSLTEENGKVLFICRAGCSQEAVLEELRARDLWKPENPHTLVNREREASNFRSEIIQGMEEFGRSNGRDVEWSEQDQASIKDATAIITGCYVQRIADVRSKPIHWLWPGRIARGKVSLLAGHPGLGKSQVTASFAAIVTSGGLWPVDKSVCEIGNVLFMSAEDDLADTIRPRLEAAGADLNRCDFLEAVRRDDGARCCFDLEQDLERLGNYLTQRGDMAMVVIDPITAYLGNTDSHKNAEVRALLASLADLSAQHDAAIVAVSHLNKGNAAEAITRITGSMAFVAAARATYAVIKDPDNADRRLLLPVKNNIGPDTHGLAFTIQNAMLDSGICTSRVMWETEPVSISASDALSADSNDRHSALDEAKEFLIDLLSVGAMGAKKVLAEAREAGISQGTLTRAKSALGIRAKKAGMGGGWEWSLPRKAIKTTEDDQDAQPNALSALSAFDAPAELGWEVEI
jgi:hypothetical protein